MRILKSHVLLRLFNSYVVDSPQPANISYLWNFGSLLAVCLVIQILTGAFLAMHYTPNVDFAFNSVEHIMRDVNNGWLIRYTHANVASFFFIFVYMHIARGMYYGSYKSPRVLVWTIGTIILILMMAIAFLGLSNSPKWFKLNNNNNKNKNQPNLLLRTLADARAVSSSNISFSSGIKNQHKQNKFNSFSALAAITKARRKSAGLNIAYVTNIMAASAVAKPRYFSNTCSALAFATAKAGQTVTEASPRKQYSEELNQFIAEKNLNPVFVYENLSAASASTVRSRVLKDTKGLSGIYLILNKVTLDYYIGSASTDRFNARFTNHLFNFNGSKVVKNAVKKYGISSFVFMVLELFPEIVTKENNKKLLDLEDFYLKTLLPNYNILTEAGSSFGYKHTEIARLNMKTNYSEERRKAIGSLNKGKTFSPDTIKLMKESALNRIKPIYSEKAIQNMKKNSKAILVYNMDYTVYGEFPSITEASKSLGCSQKTITRALKTPKKILKRR